MTSNPPRLSKRLDAWLSVGAVAALSIIACALAAWTRHWSFLLVGLGFAAFIPSRYYSPTPLFQPFRRATFLEQWNSSLTMPRWAQACDWLAIGLFALYFLIKWLA